MTAQHDAPDPHDWPAVNAWRKRLRPELIERRLAVGLAHRRAQGEAAKRRLQASFDLRRWPVLGIYWPFRGEIDVRDIAIAHIEAGGQVALPVVVEKAAPVEFRRWTPDTPMERGVWDIPIPSIRDVVAPDALLVPLLGFDGACYRLGYGGGYYDRTLAASAPRPFCIGIGYEHLRLDSIRPQPHDIPMDAIVTDVSSATRAPSDQTD